MLDALYSAAHELLGMRLEVQHFVGWDRVEYTLQAGGVWPMQEELLPEAVGQLRIFILLLTPVSELFAATLRYAHSEQRLIQAYDFGLEDLRPRILGKRRRLHDSMRVQWCRYCSEFHLRASCREAGQNYGCEALVKPPMTKPHVSTSTCAYLMGCSMVGA